MKDNFEKNSAPGRERDSINSGASTGTAAAPARELNADEEAVTMKLVRIVNEQIGKHPTLSLSYHGEEITVLGLKRDFIRCRGEQGEDVQVPVEWTYLKKLFAALVQE